MKQQYKVVQTSNQLMRGFQSSFEIQIAVLQDMISSCSHDSQQIESDVRGARSELQEFRKAIENRNQSCIREIEPRIEQLSEKIQMLWQGVKKNNETACRDLQLEQAVFGDCQDYVKTLHDRLVEIEHNI